MCCSRLACQVSTVSLSAARHVYLCLFTSTRISWISHNCVCLQGHRDSFFPFHCNPTTNVSDMLEDAIKVSSLFGGVGSRWGRRRLQKFLLRGWAVKRRVLSRTKLWRCSGSRRRCQDTLRAPLRYLWATYQTSKMLRWDLGWASQWYRGTLLLLLFSWERLPCNPKRDIKTNKPEKQLLFNFISDALGLLAHTEPTQVS